MRSIYNAFARRNSAPEASPVPPPQQIPVPIPVSIPTTSESVNTPPSTPNHLQFTPGTPIQQAFDYNTISSLPSTPSSTPRRVSFDASSGAPRAPSGSAPPSNAPPSNTNAGPSNSAPPSNMLSSKSQKLPNGRDRTQGATVHFSTMVRSDRLKRARHACIALIDKVIQDEAIVEKYSDAFAKSKSDYYLYRGETKEDQRALSLTENRKRKRKMEHRMHSLVKSYFIADAKVSALETVVCLDKKAASDRNAKKREQEEHRSRLVSLNQSRRVNETLRIAKEQKRTMQLDAPVMEVPDDFVEEDSDYNSHDSEFEPPSDVDKENHTDDEVTRSKSESEREEEFEEEKYTQQQ